MKEIIGLDAKRIVRNASGLGNYGRTLVNDLLKVCPADWSLYLYAPDEGREDLRQHLTNSEQLTFHYPSSSLFSPLSSKKSPLGGIKGGFLSPLSSKIWRSHGIVKDLKRDNVALYHGLSGELPIGIRRAGIRTVVTIHDLIFLRHPEYYHWLDTKIYGWKFRRTVHEADRIIAISECTKRDIMEYGQVPAERISVVYQSCSTFFRQRVEEQRLQEVAARYGLPARYLISVGTVEERKNILLAVRALPLLPADIHLVVVGRQRPYARQVMAEAEHLGLTARVHLLQGVPNADLPALYQQAECCVYPSRYEGFGIPIIEAIQSGLPVVACTGSCLEEAGGPDSLYVDPDDVEGMAAAVVKMLRGAEGREERISRSRQYVERFEGTDVASQVLGIYDEMLLTSST